MICKHCGAEMPFFATVCPVCEKERDRDGRLQRAALLLLAGCLLLGIVLFGIKAVPKPQQTAAAIAASSAVQTTAPTRTTNAPETTAAPRTTNAPETTAALKTTNAPETTAAPEITSAHETSAVHKTTSAAKTTAAPTTTAAELLVAPSQGTVVYVTATGTKYHKGNCSYLRSSKVEITLTEAKKQGYTPCSRCYP